MKLKPSDYARDYYTMVTDIFDSGIGDEGRLQFILEGIDKNKPLYKTDIKFLESLTEQLDLKIKTLNTNQKTSLTNHPKTLLSDEFLDKHLDKIESKKSTKIQHNILTRKNKSFFRRIFSKNSKNHGVEKYLQKTQGKKKSITTESL